ncbi:MAG: VacJ family lipoprotein [Gammaproteobacteria bacterium]|nr:VacJ family lipoprotein [Gammaproteobacteria bacterium]MBT7754267.1 VacJ family lipoprotein [Gammaproteobacteria bacterium]
MMKTQHSIVLILFSLAGCSYQNELVYDSLDPFESTNRSMYEFNENLDKAILEPAADTYDYVTPKPFRKLVNNVFNNAKYPITIANDLLQGKGKEFIQDTSRFVINTTIGLAGIFDPAASMGFQYRDEDFGQTLATWGLPQGPYMMVPFLGPYTLRELIGDVVDGSFSPLLNLDNSNSKIALNIADQIQKRSSLSALEEELYSSFDPYLYIRDSYFQNRKYKISDGEETDLIEDELIDIEDF